MKKKYLPFILIFIVLCSSIIYYSYKLNNIVKPHMALLFQNIKSEKDVHKIYIKYSNHINIIADYFYKKEEEWIDLDCRDINEINSINIEEPEVKESLIFLINSSVFIDITKQNNLVFFATDNARNFVQGIVWSRLQLKDIPTDNNSQITITKISKIQDNCYFYQAK